MNRLQQRELSAMEIIDMQNRLIESLYRAYEHEEHNNLWIQYSQEELDNVNEQGLDLSRLEW